MPAAVRKHVIIVKYSCNNNNTKLYPLVIAQCHSFLGLSAISDSAYLAINSAEKFVNVVQTEPPSFILLQLRSHKCIHGLVSRVVSDSAFRVLNSAFLIAFLMRSEPYSCLWANCARTNAYKAWYLGSFPTAHSGFLTLHF